MLEVSKLDLHALARAYFDGLLDFEQYRRARTQLLDRVTGEDTITVQQPTRPMVPDLKPSLDEQGVVSRLLYPVMAWLSITLIVVLALLFWMVAE
jgi:hypothetical protein